MSANYLSDLRARFADYKCNRFNGSDELFEKRPPGGAVVFAWEAREKNVLIPETASKDQAAQVLAAIPPNQRHRHFGSMQSSQALAQSVFGSIGTLGLGQRIADVRSEDGELAFGPNAKDSSIELERLVTTLGEPRP